MDLGLLISVHSITSLEDEKRGGFLSDNSEESECLGTGVLSYIIM